ncbi:MAG: Gfo/Idh/MocA family oxidoreductase [Oscillospiraceae bacterium]|jgi:predicted dehydrogenase|nr:Gfo/Idh/MocA family oxidoreductase [Oscillospiraceae bacterium]
MIRYGIIGTGSIAQKFKLAIERSGVSELEAVCSRDLDRARAFGAPQAYDSLDDMLKSPRVDCVYVATPHPLHFEQSKQSLLAGKPVLCEKPAVLRRAHMVELADISRRTGTLFVEALWTRFLPVVQTVKSWLGEIGSVRALTASFSFNTRFDPSSRLFAPALGGGALYDVGVYVLGFAQYMLGGRHDEIAGLSHLAPTGVDDYAAMVVRFGEAIASLQCGTQVKQPEEAHIFGTTGRVEIPAPFWCARSARLINANGEVVREVSDPQDHGWTHEAAYMANLVSAGAKESPDMGLDDSVWLTEVYETLRNRWGLPEA